MKEIFKLSILFSTMLIGCAAPLPPYTAPDPRHEQTARLRTVLIPGVRAKLFLHPNNTMNKCLIDAGAKEIPMHSNWSGASRESKQQLGMPFIDEYYRKNGSEVYLPVKDEITFSVSFSGMGAAVGAACRQAFTFKPESEGNYQMIIQAGSSQSGGVCFIELTEIEENSKKQKNVARTPIAVEGSVAWGKFCGSSGGPDGF